MKTNYSMLLAASLLSCATTMHAGETVDNNGVIVDATGTKTVYYVKSSNTSNYAGLNQPVSGSMVKVVFDEENNVAYMQNPQTSFHADTYIKGTYSDNKLSFTMPQCLYYHYFYGPTDGHRLVKPEGSEPSRADDYIIDDSKPITFTIADNGVITMDGGDDAIFGFTEYDLMTGYQPDEDPEVSYFANYETVLTPLQYQVLHAEDMPADYASKYEMWTSDGGLSLKVSVYGDKMYIGGLDIRNPEGIFVGNIDGETVTFPGGQCAGTDNYMFKAMWMYDVADDNYGDVVFSYSADKGELISKGENIGFYIGDIAKNDGVEFKYSIGSLKANRVPEGISHKPKNPYNLSLRYSEWTSCAYLDFDANDLNADGYALDCDKLYYRIYIEGKPYTFTAAEYSFLNQDISEFGYADFYTSDQGRHYSLGAYGYYNNYNHSMSFFNELDNAGVQMIYRDGDEEVASDVVYAHPYDENAVNDILIAAEAVSETYTDLSGRIVASPAPGLYIKTTAYADGTTRTVKVLVK